MNSRRSIFLKSFTLVAIFFLYAVQSYGQVKFEKKGSYSIVVDNEKYLLPQLLNAVMDEYGNLYYCDLQRVLKFDGNGFFQKEISPIGRGSGEFQTLIDCEVTENYLIILPFNEFKVLFYNLDDLSYSHEFVTDSFRSRDISALSDSTMFFLTDVERGVETSAVIGYSLSAKKEITLSKINRTPDLAYVGSTTQGAGGIVTDQEKSMFYTYVSYSQIWKYDLDTGKTKIYEDTPKYFEVSSIEELDNLKEPNDHRYYRGYMYSKSRTKGLYILGDILVQGIETGNPYESGTFDASTVNRYFEGWTTNGKKAFTELRAPRNLNIAFINQDLFYFKNGSSFSSASSKLNNGDRLPLFEIFELVR